MAYVRPPISSVVRSVVRGAVLSASGSGSGGGGVGSDIVFSSNPILSGGSSTGGAATDGDTLTLTRGVRTGSATITDTLEILLGSTVLASGSGTTLTYNVPSGFQALNSGSVIYGRNTATNGTGSTVANSNSIVVETNELDPLDYEYTFAVYRADSPSNVVSTYTSAFTADVPNNKIVTATSPSPDFAAANGYPAYASSTTFSQLGQATPVEFSTTGTLPAPLQPNTPYLLSPVAGGGYAIYPYATDADIGTLLQTAVPKENVLFGQRYYEGRYPLVIADAGSGTHTVSTVHPVLSYMEDMKSGLFGMIPTNSASNYHAHMPVITDGDGEKYIQAKDVVKIDYSGSSQTPYGRKLEVVANKIAGNNVVSQKQTLAIIQVCKINKSDTRQYVKQTFLSSGVNVTQNSLRHHLIIDDETSGRFTTGAAVKIKPIDAASVVPAPLSPTTTYYVRYLKPRVTLHTSSAGASANTDKVDITAAGSGAFTIAQTGLSAATQQALTSEVDTTTDIITINFVAPSTTNDAFVLYTTGSEVTVTPVGTGVLPTGLVAGTTYYIRVLPDEDSARVSLHTSSAGAIANTDIVDLTDVGTGGFIMYASQTPGSPQRGNFLVEWIEPLDAGGNSLSPRLAVSYSNYATSSFVTTGGSNGNLNNLDGQTGDTIDFWVPEDSTLPPPLTEGTVYYVRRPNAGSGTCTLHPTLADAIAGTNLITYTGAGTGTVQLRWADNKAEMTLGTYKGSESDVMGYRFNFGQKQIMVMLVDYNPTDATTPRGWFGINEPRTVTRPIAGVKGILPVATVKSGNPWSVCNAAQPHRPIDQELYYMAMIASPNAIDYNTVAKMVNWLGQEYTIPGFTPVALLQYTAPSAPTITNITAGNAKITVQITAGFNGNVDITDFGVRYRVNGSGAAYTTFADGVGTNNTIVIEHPDIINGTLYDVVAFTANPLGESPNSSASTAMPLAPISSPAEVSGLNLWLDASDAASFTEMMGLVTSMTDKSGAGNNPQTTLAIGTGARTVDGKNVWDFNGIDSFLLHAAALNSIGTSNYTMFFTFASDVAGGNATTRTLLCGTTSTNNPRVIAHWQSGNARVRFAHNPVSGTAQTLNGAISPDTNPHVFMVRRNGTAISIGWDGQIIASDPSIGANVTITNLATGRHATAATTDRLDGVIAEINGYNAAISDVDAVQVMNYLLDKWGIA